MLSVPWMCTRVVAVLCVASCLHVAHTHTMSSAQPGPPQDLPGPEWDHRAAAAHRRCWGAFGGPPGLALSPHQHCCAVSLQGTACGQGKVVGVRGRRAQGSGWRWMCSASQHHRGHHAGTALRLDVRQWVGGGGGGPAGLRTAPSACRKRCWAEPRGDPHPMWLSHVDSAAWGPRCHMAEPCW